MKLTAKESQDLAMYLTRRNCFLEAALRPLIVCAEEFARVSDYPAPGRDGDDVRHDVWSAALTKALAEAKDALERDTAEDTEARKETGA